MIDRLPSADPWQVLHEVGLGIAVFDHAELLIAANTGLHALYEASAAQLQSGITLQRFLEVLVEQDDVVQGGTAAWVAGSLPILRDMMSLEHDRPGGRVYELTPFVATSGFALIVQDVTTRRRADSALREARDLAEQANQSKSRFLRAASHDLRQPLATLKILIYTCQSTVDEAARNDALRAMDVSVSIIEDLLGALLSIGQLDGGGIVARIDSIPMAPLLERIALQFRHQAHQKGLDLRIIPSSLVVTADRVLLERILANLVGNALRYTDVGRVLIGCRRLGNYVEISVADTGRGIAPVHQQRIFEEFYRVGGEADRGAQKGLGLGLNIAQRFAGLLGTAISVRSAPGLGSRFAIRLPIGRVWNATVSGPNISELVAGQFAGIDILLVEDDQLLRDAVTQLLERWGISVTAVTTLADAIDLYQERQVRPDLLISDYRLPGGVRGTQVCQEVRNHFDMQTPCIVITADTDTDTLADIAADHLPYLIKPVSPAQLRVLMHHLLYEPDSDVAE